MLRGDELGVLLASHLLQRGIRGIFATTVVSSSLLGADGPRAWRGIPGDAHGIQVDRPGRGTRYGYEEALGYCVAPDLVRDKDGVSALLRVAELAAELKASGSSLLERLDDIAREYGVHATDQLSVRVDDLARIGEIMAHLRQSPPHRLGGLAVETVEDMREGTAELPGTDALRYHLASGGRVVVRPSGTEPKLKCYLEVVIPAATVCLGSAGRARCCCCSLDAIRTDLTSAAGL
jgi:phosphomannomutase